MKSFLKKFKKARNKRIVKRADKDQCNVRKGIRNSINIILILMVMGSFFSLSNMFKKISELPLISDMTAEVVSEKDLAYKKKSESIFKDHSIKNNTAITDIEELDKLYSDSSKSEEIKENYDFLTKAWEEKIKRTLLQSFLDNKKVLPQEEVDRYFKVYNDYQSRNLGIESSQKKESDEFIISLKEVINQYNSVFSSIVQAKKEVEEQKDKLVTLGKNTIQLTNFVGEDATKFNNWVKSNGLRSNISYEYTEDFEKNNVVKTQFPNTDSYKKILKGETVAVTIYEYKKPYTTETSSNDGSSTIENSQSSSLEKYPNSTSSSSSSSSKPSIRASSSWYDTE